MLGQMRSAEYRPGRRFIGRFEHDSELLKSITDFVKEKRVRVGVFSIVGAVKGATIAYYDQTKHEYREVQLEGPHEIVSCTGNISLKDGAQFAHAHIVLADERGNVKAGHLIRAKVFAAEIHLHELLGPELVREYDELTGLSLWKL